MSRNYDRDRYWKRRDEDEETYDRDDERRRYGSERSHSRSYDDPYGRRYSRRGAGSESEYERYGRGTRYGMDYDREFGTTGTPMRRGYDYGRGRDRYTLGGEYGSSSRVGTGVGYSGARSDLGEYRDYESEREGYYGRTHSGGYGYGGRGRGVDREYNRGYDREYDREYDRGYGEREERGWLDRAADQVRSWFGDEESERRRSMDKASEGEHRGRGPRGYRRSDERIREEINDRLTDHPYLDASDIEVTVNSGEVTLSGMVDNRNAKHLAEDIAEDISGVTNVENRLRVRQTRWGAASSTEERTTTAETLRTIADREAAATTTSTGSSGRRTS